MKRIAIRLGGMCLALGTVVHAALADQANQTAAAVEEGAAVQAQTVVVEEEVVTGAPANTEILSQAPVQYVLPEHVHTIWDRMEWSLAVDGIIQGNTGSSTWEDQADAVYGIDIDALFQIDDRASVYCKVEAGGGEGVDGHIATFSGFNDHAWGDDSIEVVEIWYEQTWADGLFRGRIGKVDLTTDFDTNAYANCEHEQFISSGFINNLTTDIPDNTIGAMFWFEPTECFNVGVGWQSTSSWDDIFDRSYGILEIGWHPVFNGHQGNYRFYGWAGSYDGEFDEELGEEVGAYSNYGWGFSFDQEITCNFGLWCRYGWKPNEEYNPFDQHITFGAQFMNFYWRPDDAFGIAYGVADLSEAYASTLENPDDETHLEIYYRAKVNDYISITPNVQFVDNAEGDANNDGVYVIGLRGVFMM